MPALLARVVETHLREFTGAVQMRDMADAQHQALRDRMDLLAHECEARVAELAEEAQERRRQIRQVWVALIGTAGSLAVWVLTRLT